MLIRCDDCGTRPFNQWVKSCWHPIPADFFTRGGTAMRFWLELHGHLPKVWVFKCECGATMESGGLVALANDWDDIMLAQNDWGFYEQHKTHHIRVVS